ncbi:MAG: AraC family transcriptional regulator [Peptococcaceae bacterium]|nr:AraC family transcriptional regulator [Peptococcaceae bacterium]
MTEVRFNQEWYGARAKILAQGEDGVVVDYGCAGRGIVKNLALFDGIQLCFLDFDTAEVMNTQSFNPDILQITHCQAGRYECEFANHLVTYLPAGYFSVATTAHLPVSFSFPLGKYVGVSLVIDRQALSESTRRMMQGIPIDLDKIGTTLGLENRWYVSETPPALQQLFSALYAAAGNESVGYYRIKATELLYHMEQLTLVSGCDLKYFDKKQIRATKAIRDHLVTHLDEKLPLAALAEEAQLPPAIFHQVFAQIYGDTPYAYLKKYKMNLAAQWLSENTMKIGDVALALGYSNASKFAKAFQSVYGVLPKDYRKKV